eukprot:scaffold115204_cov45-Phaeocystis_antarctica.AAC.1
MEEAGAGGWIGPCSSGARLKTGGLGCSVRSAAGSQRWPSAWARARRAARQVALSEKTISIRLPRKGAGRDRGGQKG